MAARRIQISKIRALERLSREVLLEVKERDLQRFTNWTSLNPIIAIYDAVTTLDAKSRAMLCFALAEIAGLAIELGQIFQRRL
jgi:hypothetical protein